MSGLLDGHIAVVTGGGSGIGRAIAAGYAREGAQVAEPAKMKRPSRGRRRKRRMAHGKVRSGGFCCS